MGSGLQGENLIFLISQPRAGSTLLQRILGSHPDIHTVSEPWLMLHPLYALHHDGYQAEYDAHQARTALQDFLRTLPDGEDEYLNGVRRMYTYLYEQAIASSGKRYFLDKTPRYYFTISELHRTFSKAHFITLLRNPLAVLCSLLNTWFNENLLSLHRCEHDLIRAPCLLLQGLEALGEQGTVVYYERLVSDPEDEVRAICQYLGINFVPDMIEYGSHSLPRWSLGDQKEIHKHMHPVPQIAERWIETLEDPQAWRLVNDYLQLLGEETVKQMGYPYDELHQVLEARRPPLIHLWLTFPLAWLLKTPAEDRSGWEHSVVRRARSLQRRCVRRIVR